MLKLKRRELVNRIIEEAALPVRGGGQSFTRIQLLELFLFIVNTKKLIKDLKESRDGNAARSSAPESVQATRISFDTPHD